MVLHISYIHCVYTGNPSRASTVQHMQLQDVCCAGQELSSGANMLLDSGHREGVVSPLLELPKLMDTLRLAAIFCDV